MKKKIAIFSFLSLILGLLAGILVQRQILSKPTQNKIIQKIVDRTLDKYTIDSLGKAYPNINPVAITKERVVEDKPGFTSYLFTFSFDPSLGGGGTKKVSGIINIPKSTVVDKKFPLILMARGYVDADKYVSGEGTQHGAEAFANNGFITVAPDFLGYGESDKEPSDTFEARFQTYTTFMTLMKSVNNIPEWDGKNIFLWGHSNGGQILLTVLEITGVEYPTVLWAPVSKPFPYSILFYTDEADDLGRFLRKKLADFEAVYDPNLYSIHNYLDRIKAPIELEQGTADVSVPFIWSDDLNKKLKEDKVEIIYNVYPGADHNLMPSWNTVVARDIAFFNKHI
ncbi:MAG TPA: alpha/beta hydrolase [Patescibacteria group bacterium]